MRFEWEAECAAPSTSQPVEEGVAIITVFVNIEEGPRSFADQHHLQDQECCQAPHVRGACPALIIGGVKCLQRRKNISAWRGHEDNGGEGQLGREPGYSGGGQFFPKENLCKLLFVRILLSLSQVQGCISCGILLSGT